jgi:iron complex transport system ATP-binding protein
MEVFGYVLLGRTPYIPYFGSESDRDIEITREVIRSLELDHLAGRQLGAISGGEAQRVVLARALVQEAPVLLLDEPTEALDIGHQQQVLELVDAIRKERRLTVLCAMHDLTHASQFTDVLVLMDGGRMVSVGPPAEVLTEAAIQTHFDASVRIDRGPDGAIVVVPIRTART